MEAWDQAKNEVARRQSNGEGLLNPRRLSTREKYELVEARRREFVWGTGFRKRVKWLLANRKFGEIVTLMYLLPHPGSFNQYDNFWSEYKAIEGGVLSRWDFLQKLAERGMRESASSDSESVRNSLAGEASSASR